MGISIFVGQLPDIYGRQSEISAMEDPVVIVFTKNGQRAAQFAIVRDAIADLQEDLQDLIDVSLKKPEAKADETHPPGPRLFD